MSLIILRKIPSTPIECIMNGYYQMFSIYLVMFLFFLVLICYIILIELNIFNCTFIPGINLTCSRCIVNIMCCWIKLDSILLRIFVPVFTSSIGSYICFSGDLICYGNACLGENTVRHCLEGILFL